MTSTGGARPWWSVGNGTIRSLDLYTKLPSFLWSLRLQLLVGLCNNNCRERIDRARSMVLGMAEQMEVRKTDRSRQTLAVACALLPQRQVGRVRRVGRSVHMSLAAALLVAMSANAFPSSAWAQADAPSIESVTRLTKNAIADTVFSGPVFIGPGAGLSINFVPPSPCCWGQQLDRVPIICCSRCLDAGVALNF